MSANHTVRNCMAWDNARSGVIDNNNPGQHLIDRCTAWDNGSGGFYFDRSDSTLTKNLAVANADPSTITGPRNADGSIRSSTFLRPANGADVGARF